MGGAGSGERGGDTAGEGKFLVGLTGTMFTNMTFQHCMAGGGWGSGVATAGEVKLLPCLQT